jgi:hypothetical protein
MLSPATAAAQHTTDPIDMAKVGPNIGASCLSRPSSNNDEVSIVAKVIPDMGLFDEPTTPDMYAPTAENRNPKITIKIVIGRATSTIPSVMCMNNPNIAGSNTTNVIPIICMGISAVCA